MTEQATETCAYPECDRGVVAVEGAGRPARYCDLAGHNAQTAFRERRRRASAGEPASDDIGDGGERPVSLAAASLRILAGRLAGDLERTREVVAALSDPEQLEAELAAVRADAQAEVSRGAQLEATARRERLEADEAAEAALRAAGEADARAQAAAQRETAALEDSRQAEAAAADAERAAQDATARAEAAIAAQAAAQATEGQARETAAAALSRAETAEAAQAEALHHARVADGERDDARAQARTAEETAARAREEATRARELAEAAEQRAAQAESRGDQADERAQAAVDRADRLEQQARTDRAELDAQLDEHRDARQIAELERSRAQATLDGEVRLRAKLEGDLGDGQHRLAAAEKARDAAIAALEQAATRGMTPPARGGRGGSARS